jgi:hypothetical protein
LKNPFRVLYSKAVLWVASGMSEPLHNARAYLFGDFTLADFTRRSLRREDLIWLINYHRHLEVKLAAVRMLALTDQGWMKYLVSNHPIEAVQIQAVISCHDHQYKVSLAMGSHSEEIRAAAVHDLYGPALEAVVKSPFEDVRLAYLKKLGIYAPCVYLMMQNDASPKVRKFAREILKANQDKLRATAAALTASHTPPTSKNRPN